MTVAEHISNINNSFDKEVEEVLKEQPSLTREDAEFLVLSRRWYGYQTHVWI